MPRCVTCGTASRENPILDAFFCIECRATWCGSCQGSENRCPECTGARVVAFTLTEDAYL